MLVVKKVTCVVDSSIVVKPFGALNQIEMGHVDGVRHSLYGIFGFENRTPTANNFDAYRLIRMRETHEVVPHLVQYEPPPTGLGESTLPPAGAAAANALKSATGRCIYKQQLMEDPDFWKTTDIALIG